MDTGRKKKIGTPPNTICFIFLISVPDILLLLLLPSSFMQKKKKLTNLFFDTENGTLVNCKAIFVYNK